MYLLISLICFVIFNSGLRKEIKFLKQEGIVVEKPHKDMSLGHILILICIVAICLSPGINIICLILGLYMSKYPGELFTLIIKSIR